MTLYQFNGLDEQEQIEAVWNKGVLLAEVKEETFEYKLYQINAFYVEFKIPAGDPGYGQMRSFVSTDPLDRYLNFGICFKFN